MYAVIETGGKQYRVELGTELEVELLDVEPGQEITLDRVLLVADGEQAAVGRPLVTDALVSARVLRQDRGDKVVSFKYRPKARRRVKKGHRQELTVLQITDVRLGDKSAAALAGEQAAQEKTERERVAEAAARQAAEDAALAAKLAERAKAAEAPVETETKPARRTRATKAAAEAPAAPEAAAEGGAEAEEPAQPAAESESAPEDTDVPGAAPKKRARTKKDE